MNLENWNDPPGYRSNTRWAIIAILDPRDNSGDIQIGFVEGTATPTHTHEFEYAKRLAEMLGCGIECMEYSMWAAARRAWERQYGLQITYKRAHARIWHAIEKRRKVLKARRKEKRKHNGKNQTPPA
jgi:hypothetical protein